MALTLSGREVGLVYTLLQRTNDGLLEISPASSVSTDNRDAALSKSVRLNKLIVANLRQKIQSELAEKG